MPGIDQPMRHFAGAVLATAALILVIALAYADGAGHSGEVILAPLAPAVEALLAVGGEIDRNAGALLAKTRLPALLLIAAVLALRVVRRNRTGPTRQSSAAPTLQRIAALALGWIARPEDAAYEARVRRILRRVVEKFFQSS